jgi:alkanesulfonate monooxygenase SsuD/methylene tetrahydromethanopterin reductase-like flavin-dependent oxidoreductase (luciferase family)
MADLRFGIFDWLDDTRRPLAETWEQRLKMLEYADQAGFFAYHLAEHHGTPLSTAPSPNLFFAALAQRTRRLRFGPMAYLLPMYHPIRLIEEICILDHVSGGRLELGVGRPASPHEARLYGVDMAEARAAAHEALAVVTEGLARGEINFDGKHYRLADMKLFHRPVQRPYPPLWYPTATPGSMAWIGEHGFSTLLLCLFSPPAQLGEQLRVYRQALAEHTGRPGRFNSHVARPNHGFGIQIYVADTDDEARRVAREAHAVFFENFNYLWVQQGDPERHRARGDFETFVRQGLMTYGAPDTVRATLQEYLDVTGANYLAGVFAFGGLTEQQTMRSLHLFTTEVKPRLVARPAPDVEERAGRR